MPWFSRFALLAAWALAIVPSLSHAWAWADGRSPNVLQICTAEGMRWVDAATGDVSDADPASGSLGAHSLEHCPYCNAQSPWAALPSADRTVDAADAPIQALPQRFLQAPRTAHAWRPAQPRAPPSQA
jgi:Protein of unknown function (DUF2946)